MLSVSFKCFLFLEKYGPPNLNYGWTEFLADIKTYKTISFVLATTLLPNVLSDIQVNYLCIWGRSYRLVYLNIYNLKGLRIAKIKILNFSK